MIGCWAVVTTEIEFNFSKQQPFQVSFTDFPKGEEAAYELDFENGASLPAEIKSRSQGLRISGNNHSDDLFMYAYKKVTGLKPNTMYQVDFSLEFASNARTGSVGAGGSPGDCVYVKMGTTTHKPARYVDKTNFYQLDLDKGNQGTGGKDLILMGTIGVETEALYSLKTLAHQSKVRQATLHNYSLTTNNLGEFWIIFGTDSGYESTTTIFYTHLLAQLHEIPTQ
ncbi:MAG: hypothetical protein H0U75_13140 [Legionella sp.]|nr:hypothetical protein [Legionella sp.]